MGSAFFFVSFVLITAFVLTNVVVAVLLDKMVDASVDVAEMEDLDMGKMLGWNGCEAQHQSG